MILEARDGIDQFTVRFAAAAKLDPELLMQSLYCRYSRNLAAGHVAFEQVPTGSLSGHPVSGKIIGLINKRS